VDWVYRQFGEKLHDVRSERQLSQAYVAEHIGLSRTSISNIEHGRQRIALHLVYLLAEAIRADPLALLPPAAVSEGVVPTRDLSGLGEREKKFVTDVVSEQKPSTSRGAR